MRRYTGEFAGAMYSQETMNEERKEDIEHKLLSAMKRFGIDEDNVIIFWGREFVVALDSQACK